MRTYFIRCITALLELPPMGNVGQVVNYMGSVWTIYYILYVPRRHGHIAQTTIILSPSLEALSVRYLVPSTTDIFLYYCLS